ncbi:MAG: HAMP domain-containing histidine kinase [Atopostipes sp.]|nr:HAMP domain-containing histidine kinase [Atopostipes sp.]
MLDSEKEEMKELSEELVDRFSNHYYVLEKDSVASMLEEPQIELGPIPAPENYIKKEEEFKPPVTLTKGGIVVRIFDDASELVYGTDVIDIDFEASDELRVNEVAGPDGTALSMVEPVYSKYHDKLLGYIQTIQTLEGYHEMTDDITHSIIIIGLAALIFSSIIGWLLINSFVKPITELTQAMESIRDNLESDVRLDEGTKNNELSKLARTYNDMVDLMQENITSQRQFVEDVSHELRTPVAIVEGHLKMLNRWGKDDPEVLEESIEASLTETKRMKTLVQEMLDLSRVQEIDIHYKHEQTNILSLVEQLIENFRMLYPDFSFIIDEDLKEPLSILMYRNHLEQVLVNILDNAVKYSEDRKEIHISLSTRNDWVNLSIQDFGTGMEETDLKKIFNRFYRVDKARSREKGGTGLGLPIVKELIEGYGGEVKVTSVIDRGTIFHITLPIIEE